MTVDRQIDRQIAANARPDRSFCPILFVGSECDFLLTLAPVSSPVKGASYLELRKIGFEHRPLCGLETVRMYGVEDKKEHLFKPKRGRASTGI